MALVLENFKAVGGPGNSPDGGQSYSVFSLTDTLAEMMVDGYLDGLSDTLNDRDNITLAGIDGAQMVHITLTSGVITVSTLSASSPAQAISGPGAVDITSPSTDISTTGADAFTLADGMVGQEKEITLVVDGGNAVLTPDNALGYSMITFADAGDSVQLRMKTGGWALVGQGGLGTGPLSA